ncbi:hypothetical protein QGN32_15935 [Mycolicibacterium sp. ND9-15]|uniref:hypothetical protein n=1 Tax=Mycolicibacterium sp. ND9-15 TaxID=3042320 RepID=UPI002DD9655B|nr:hypothetical protein [Mycolicibacterium sp. ND9-15]WSE54954.1 hypothetical protein QGN32_15935 [Mycolicibacterium sp. ND9-15]
MDNVLDPLDQLIFVAERAMGIESIPQFFWVYNRPVDIDGLRKFHHYLNWGRLSRRIERSPLRFGRHRWVSPEGPSELETVATPRPRAELDAWLEEQATTRPIDAEHGPGWHLAVLPFTDGGAAVSLAISHSIADGLGSLEAIADAADGRDAPIDWPTAASRRRWQAVREDARQTMCDIPALGRGTVAAVRLARHARREGGGGASFTKPLELPAGADEPLMLPKATVFIDADEWRKRAHTLGGTSNALLMGLTARVAQRMGRVTADGLVLMRMAVKDRAATGDTRANAATNLTLTVDPTRATTDLREIRASVKQALISHQETRDDERAMTSLAPLLGLLPKRLVRLVDNTAVSSNVGVVNPAVIRADGTDADLWAGRLFHRGVTKALMHRVGGALYVVSGTALGQVFVSATAYQPGYTNSNDSLRQDVSKALDDLSLAGTYIGPPPITH